MKRTGIIILAIGLLFTLISTLGILVKEHVTDPGKIEMAQLKVAHRVWEPMVGVILIIVGTGMYKVSKKGALRIA